VIDYSLHPALERASIDDYIALFDLAFPGNDKLGRAYLEWLYRQNPDGPAVGMDAYLGDELAAHYVTIPRTYRQGGATYRALLSVNTATHPRHQQRGLFKRLANATYEAGQAQGFQFVLGAANANSTHGFIRSLGFEHLGQIRMVAWCGPDEVVERLRLDTRPDWLAWRLARPQASYRLSRLAGGRVRIQTRQRGLGVTLGFVPAESLAPVLTDHRVHSLPWLPNLTPIFPVPGASLRLPDRLHPSPWNVIFRPLGAAGHEIDTRLLQYDGLAMDTF